MARDRRNEKRGEHFTKMIRMTMQTPAWRALSPTAQALYPWLKLEWRGPKANNNGKIRLSVRQTAERMGCNIKTAARGFHDLQAKGFVVVTEGARLGVGGEAKSPTYELTEIEMPNSELRGGRRLYLNWRAEADYPVCKAAANNPKGKNGKTEPHARIGGSTVILLGTK
ncbi:MAG: hypothetical protein GY947_12760 [Rhodobacteraceae bacterium]|nr:hypothetical protein [Paracoccaceae bacterium]